MIRATGPRYAYSAHGYAWRRTLSTLAARPLSSSLSLAVLGLVLALPILLFFVAAALETTRGDNDGGGATLTAYLDIALNDLDGAALSAQLAQRAGIQSTRYISRDEALATFQAESDLGDALELLDENPLPGAIVIVPERTTNGAAPIQALADSLGALDTIDEIRYDLQWVERLHAVASLLRIAALLLAGFLTLTALLVIANTIRLELLARRAEQEVCHLLGASTRFTHRPFVYAGLVYGVIGGLLATGMALLAFGILKAPADQLASLYGSDAGLHWPAGTQLALFPVAGALLGLLGAWVTLHAPSQHKVRQGR